MFGLYNVNKPAGPTSHDVVAVVRKLLPRNVRVGHAGTLDPFADGVLVLCVGPATRLAELVQKQLKRYRAEVVLGARSETDDPEGPIVPEPAARPPSGAAVREAVARFVGEIEQVPPGHSAVHINGRRAYKLARAGHDVELAPRSVQVQAVEVVDYAWPRLTIDVRCGSGTYIRALARDIGQALGMGGYCGKLTRTEVGDFRLEDAVPTDRLDIAADLLPPTAALGDTPRLTVPTPQITDVAHGRLIRLGKPHPPGLVALLDDRDRLLAVGEVDETALAVHPQKVFVPAG